jgi:hypothetical protein
MGTNFRDWLVETVASGRRGRADLVAFFFLRAYSLLTPRGNLGLIATNTIAQGDTREVGLDQMAADGFTITRAIQSRSWPAASANLEYAAVWGSQGTVSPSAQRVSDDSPVARISTLLEPAGKVDGSPVPLQKNAGIAFGGWKPYGQGFILDPSEAQAWIAADPQNSEILFPFLNGEDLNSRPDTSAPSWVIDFNDRSEEEAKKYPLAYGRVLELVKPERQRKKPDGSYQMRNPLPQRWWQYAEKRPALRRAIRKLHEVLVITVVSKTVMPMRMKTGQVFSHALAVFATDSFADQAVLSSSLHQMWAIKYGSGMRSDPRYTPSDVFETFPRPEPSDRLETVGRTLDTERREIMLRRDLGLTKLYNLVNDPDYADDDIDRMRQIHVELDQAVMDTHGWGDVPLDHGFHTYRQMQRWTVSPEARVRILDLLLKENLLRAAAQGEAPPPGEDEDEGGDE